MGWDFDLMGMGGMLQSYRGHFFYVLYMNGIDMKSPGLMFWDYV